MDEEKGKGFTVDHAIMLSVALMGVVGAAVVKSCIAERETATAQAETLPAPAPPIPVAPPPPPAAPPPVLPPPPAPEAEKTERPPATATGGASRIKQKKGKHEKAGAGDQNIHIGSIKGGQQQFNNNSPGSKIINEGPPPPQLLQGKVVKNQEANGVYETRIEVQIISAFPPASLIADVHGGRSITQMRLQPANGNASMVWTTGIGSSGGSMEAPSPHGTYALTITSKEPENDLDVKWGFGQ